MQFGDAKTTNEACNTVNDRMIGMSRGQAGPMLFFVDSNNTDNGVNVSDSQSPKENTDNDNEQSDADSNQNREDHKQWHSEGDLCAVTKGTADGKKCGTGYGEWWRCGEWGRPRRECPHFNVARKGE